tara:strand:- start:138 stop:434 length:297 start_codon:yes stop_codon:yes gene_type:complete
MIDIKHNGKRFVNVTSDGYHALGIPKEVYEQAVIDNNWAQIRAKRDKLISETDWTQVADVQLSEEKKSEFAAYRQELRDLPQTYANPDDVIWPVKPAV